jgi:hypothetical protein
MSGVLVEEAVLGGALRSTHFFNGRLLTGEDLGREQRTTDLKLARLGEGVGDGVVEGLAVSVKQGSTAARPVVTVTRGLAISRSGIALELGEETDVTLARTGPRPGAEPGGLFADCQPYTASEYSTGAGVYLLALGPASAEEGLAPVSGLHNRDAPCNTASTVETVSFRLVRLALPLAELDDAERLRNAAAYRMFDPAAVDSLERDPGAATLDRLGLLDRLRGVCLGEDHVPLALIGWEADAGIAFVDHWSVRRRVTRRPAPGRFAPFASDRLVADGEARFLQFQEQMSDRLDAGGAASCVATDELAHLPAAGILRTGGARFDAGTFFQGLTVRGPLFVEGARLGPLLRASFLAPPLDLASGEMLWLYKVRENRDPEVAGSAAARPVVVFAGGHLRYAGQPQFDLAHWDFANYALPVG